MHHVFDSYAPVKSGALAQRTNGVLISNGTGKALAYGLFNLQERGRLFTGAGDEVYEGQIVGIHSRENDLTVNPLKAKQLNNIRAASKDENLVLSPAIRMTLEQALEFIDDDELVEITPAAVRVRKRLPQGARAQTRGSDRDKRLKLGDFSHKSGPKTRLERCFTPLFAFLTLKIPPAAPMTPLDGTNQAKNARLSANNVEEIGRTRLEPTG
jgi:hypothetical protein